MFLNIVAGRGNDQFQSSCGRVGNPAAVRHVLIAIGIVTNFQDGVELGTVLRRGGQGREFFGVFAKVVKVLRVVPQCGTVIFAEGFFHFRVVTAAVRFSRRIVAAVQIVWLFGQGETNSSWFPGRRHGRSTIFSPACVGSGVIFIVAAGRTAIIIIIFVLHWIVMMMMMMNVLLVSMQAKRVFGNGIVQLIRTALGVVRFDMAAFLEFGS
mmetsp:Transcript_7952/g.16696  ORF Transcript_7952/g.16696 Transcript_7952/m.16696 type:complete len:210 (+) Transcript_7952:349-978(+)